MHGFLILDKPAGVTSHDVVNRVRKVLWTRQVGHAGTLDPMATGVLVVAVGWATKLLELVVSDTKGYDAVIELGRVTDTDDVTGQTLETFSGSLPDLTKIEEAVQGLRGEISQRPPAFSAIKQGGQPSYKKARQGDLQELPSRHVTISEFTLTEYHSPLLSARIVGTSGTYIRSLARDLGQALGCGGTLAALRRWRSGHWSIESALPLNDLKDSSQLLPLEIVLSWLPHLEVSNEEYQRLLQGSPLAGDRLESDPLPLITHQGKIIGMVRWKEGQWWPRKVRPREVAALTLPLGSESATESDILFP